MIIDFHTHVFPDKIAERTVKILERNGSIPSHSNGTVDGLLAVLSRSNVDIGVNLPVITRADQFESVNGFARSLNERDYTGARIISFAGIHPDTECPEEAIARIVDMGFLGIKIHPDYQDAFIDDERYVRILRVAKNAGLITITHSGVDGAYIGQQIKCTPQGVLRLLDRLGGYDKLVLAHLGANAMYTGVLECLAGEDVYFDTAYCLRSTGKYAFLKLLEAHGADRMLFASDSPWQDPGAEIRFIKELDLGADEDKILYKNASKLLKLD